MPFRTYRVGAPVSRPYTSLVDLATPPGQQPDGQTGYTLVFSDEFEGSSLNLSKWIPFYPDTDFWNATVPGGHLSNTDEPEAYDISGISFPGGSIMRLTMRDEVTVPGLPFTSGMVCSYPSFNPIYGYFEARMKLSNNQGLWPAFWMDPTDMLWPPEIDFMENFAIDAFNAGIRCGYIRPGGAGNTSAEFNVGDVGASWHTYACEWRAGSISFYCNGSLLTTYTGGDVVAKQMYLICNLAGQPGNEAALHARLPAFVDVDYIRAWA